LIELLLDEFDWVVDWVVYGFVVL